MKPLTQQIVIGVAGCAALTLVLGYGLSIAVNYGISKFEERTVEFLPKSVPSDDAPASIP